MRKNTQRTNQAYKIAYWSEVQRIKWTTTLTAFCHGWTLLIMRLLIPSAVTALQFFAALHRAGKNGYIGCAVAYELLAPQVALATQRPCSVRTLARGLSCLRTLGLVHLHWWTVPDQIVRHGDHEVKIKGTARVETPEGWKCCQIRIALLTERAIAMWDRSTCKKGCVYIPHFTQFHTHAKLAGNSQIDQVGKPTMIKSVPCDVVSPQGMCQTESDFEPSKDQSSPPIASGEQQGWSTRPGPPTADQTFEQHVNPADEPVHETKTVDLPKAFDESLPFPQLGTELSSARGVSHTPPALPKATVKTTWPVARAYLLHDLAGCLCKYSRREADAIYERARWELSGEYPAGWPTSIDWPYWVGRFADFSLAQRRSHIVRDILPVLKSKCPIVPSEPRRFTRSNQARSRSGLSGVEKIGDQLAPFLKSLFDRFCVED